MRNIIKKFIQFPFYANMIIAVVLLAGLFSVGQMKKSFFPERTSRIINVSVYYPGASPVEMEEGVTSRIEESIRGIVGIREITSSSSENFANVTVETTGEYDIDETLMEVKNAVDGISSFPSASERPVVRKRRSSSNVLILGISGDVGYLALKERANEIEEDLLSSGVISQVQFQEAPQPEISVEIKELERLKYNVSFDEISAAIRNNNNDVSGGQLKSDTENILIRLRSRSSNPDKIGNIVVRANPDGSIIRIKDVAIVTKKYSDDYIGTKLNGKDVILIDVNKLPEEDMVVISDYCKNYIKEFNKKSESVKLDMGFDRTDILNDRLDLLVGNGELGLILVILCLAFFLSFRLSLWVAWGIPSAFLGMFIIAKLAGVTINMISLFGMILVIGILVDDGIVIAENIYAHFERGKPAKQAALDGTMEVLPAVITSVLTTILAFCPLLFLQGRMEMIYEMAFIVIIALVISLFEAFFVLPAHVGSKHVLNPKTLTKEARGLRKHLDSFMFWLREKVYAPCMEYLLKYRYPTVAVAIFLMLGTAGLLGGGFIKTTFFPSVDFDHFNIEVAFTPGAGEKQTLKFLKKFDKAIWDVNEDLKKQFKDSNDFITNTFISVGWAFQGTERGTHAGNIFILPRKLDDLDITGMEISSMVKKKIGEVPEARKFTVGGSNRWGSPVSIGLMSRNLVVLDEAKEFLMTELSKIPALKDIIDNNAQGKQEVILKLKDKAYFLGLNERSLANQIRYGFYGGQVQRLQEGRDELRVWVRYPKEGRENIGQLEQMKIVTPSGEYPLIELAEYTVRRGPVTIRHYNGKREGRVDAELLDPYASVTEILMQVKKEIIPVLKAKYPSIDIVYQGQQKTSNEAMSQIKTFYTIAFALIVAILMMHFRSVSQALIILLMIPLSFLGVMWGHGIHMKPVSLMSVWGIVALSGVVINDAVVFLAKFNSLMEVGGNMKDSIIEAGKSRLRPIILTSITTSVGLFPMILEKSPQAQFLIPTALSLAYGVVFGTIFILIFFPVFIHVLNDIKVYCRYLWKGEKPSREEVCIAVINKQRENMNE